MGQESSKNEWVEYDRRILMGLIGLLGLVAGVALIAIGISSEKFLLIILGGIMVGFEFYFIYHIQNWLCPKCGKPFAYQKNPFFEHWALFRVLNSTTCQSCGVKHRTAWW